MLAISDVKWGGSSWGGKKRDMIQNMPTCIRDEVWGDC
jgi:hypothetical protein